MTLFPGGGVGAVGEQNPGSNAWTEPVGLFDAVALLHRAAVGRNRKLDQDLELVAGEKVGQRLEPGVPGSEPHHDPAGRPSLRRDPKRLGPPGVHVEGIRGRMRRSGTSERTCPRNHAVDRRKLVTDGGVDYLEGGKANRILTLRFAVAIDECPDRISGVPVSMDLG